MLHIRYDWRRPVFWAGICLTFFLSSQNSYTWKSDADPTGFIKEGVNEKLITGSNVEVRAEEPVLSSVYFLTAKR